ncbi:hypothetical protein WKH54_02945 [Priestia megaterium]|uniref:hypothetical protein n=1 Tax=Priestia megaterium TaxID=1404 RepID=UPI00316DE7A3
MKKITLITLIASVLLLVSTSIDAKALALPELPTKETSKQWSVEVTKPNTEDPNLAKAKKGVYHTYSLDVENIGKDVRDVKVQLFRNEANSITKYGLLPTTEPPQLSQKGGHPYRISNFGLSEKATDLNIVITWKEQGAERLYQETFTFHQK